MPGIDAHGKTTHRDLTGRMNLKEIKELVEYLIEKDISDFELERGDVKVRIRRGSHENVPQVHYVPAPAAAPSHTAVPHAASAAAERTPAHEPAKAAEEGLHTVKSPIVGTYFESPSPGSAAFVKPGDSITAGQVLCIVEAMKLMNEIESDAAGELV
jgi:acetyl-CoA carboxylase biotin carboxyl carrier protein